MRGRVAAVALLLAAAGCSGSQGGDGKDEAKSSGPSVELKLLAFQPDHLTVKAGTTVTWRNAEPITHTVTSGRVSGVDASTGLRSGQMPDGMFDGQLARKGTTFTYTFHQPGSYSYYCSIHKGMNATVEVTA